MDLMDISRKRFTLRRFASTPVEEEKLAKILEAGRWAPTAVNGQPQRILVLNTPEDLEKVRQFCTFGYDEKAASVAKESVDPTTGGMNFCYTRSRKPLQSGLGRAARLANPEMPFGGAFLRLLNKVLKYR